MAGHREIHLHVNVKGFMMMEFVPLLHLCSVKSLVGKFAGKSEQSVPCQWNCFGGSNDVMSWLHSHSLIHSVLQLFLYVLECRSHWIKVTFWCQMVWPVPSKHLLCTCLLVCTFTFQPDLRFACVCFDYCRLDPLLISTLRLISS